MNKHHGFTLLELMIVVAIIGILAAIALPAYQTYSDESRYTEVILASSNHKRAIEVCVQLEGSLAQCAPGTNGVPPNAGASSMVKSVVWLETAGTLTVTPLAQGEITEADTYVLTATLNNGRIAWTDNCDAFC